MKNLTIHKLLLVSSAFLLSAFCLFGCGNNETQNNADDMAQTEDTNNETNTDDNTSQVGTENPAPTETPAALTDLSLLDIMDKIYEIDEPVLNVFRDTVDISDPDAMFYNTGLNDLTNVKEAAISEPMMSSQAYSLVLVRVNDESKVSDVASAMKSGINPAKWICVEADDLQVVSYEDVILLIMVSSQLSESATSQEIVDAFSQVCGGEVTSY
ncbi:MAG: hypothetical protein ACI4DW_08325 [Lachnospiraceae bacterium]